MLRGKTTVDAIIGDWLSEVQLLSKTNTSNQELLICSSLIWRQDLCRCGQVRRVGTNQGSCTPSEMPSTNTHHIGIRTFESQ